MTLTSDLRENYALGVPFEVAPGNQLLHELLFAASGRYPQRVALDFMARSTTYRELENQVRKAARVLHNQGVRQGDRVALIMPNCPQHVVAIFAISLLGAIIVEHNPLAPREELRAEFERHGAKVVVAWDNSIDKLDFLGSDATVLGVNLATALSSAAQTLLKIPLASIREKRNLLGAKPDRQNLRWDREVKKAKPWTAGSPATVNDPALLIHTGGTTGVPKAVVLTHRNLGSNAIQSVAWVPELHEGAETFYAVLPLFHAFGFGVNLIAGVHLGATIALFPKFDPVQVLLSQRRLPCTFFLGVPPIYETLLRMAPDFDTDFSSIRYAISGAMPISAELAARWEAATGGYLIEGYGMSEASPIILGSPLSPKRRPSSLGIPFPSTEVKIVDPEAPENEVASGEVGELIVKGPQVFVGYWNDPEETAEVLRDGWLFTGDLVRVVDGFIVMADRRKELIISGGFNIYPSQVEEVVRGMPGISDVAVVGMPGGARGEDVVAALVLEAGASLTLADVREWAEKSLAHYALPRQIVVVQELPKSQIGKVMRKKVREQIDELQAGWGSKLSALGTQVSDLAGQATAAVKSSWARPEQTKNPGRNSETEADSKPADADPKDHGTEDLPNHDG